MRVVSLAYHDVVDPGQFESSGFSGREPYGDPNHVYKMEVPHFLQHLAALDAVSGNLLSSGYTALNLKEARSDVVLLHFDDGGKSALRIAEMLSVRGWRGHFWITTGRIDTPGFVSRSDIRALHGAGHVVGSHSRSHPMQMGKLTDSELYEEWRDSLNALSDICGEAIVTASVPGGYCNQRVVEAAAGAGVETLFNSEPTRRSWRMAGCLVLGRYSIKGRTPASEAASIAQGMRLPRYRQWTTWNAKKLAKRAAGRYWLELRRRALSLG